MKCLLPIVVVVLLGCGGAYAAKRDGFVFHYPDYSPGYKTANMEVYRFKVDGQDYLISTTGYMVKHDPKAITD